MNESLLAQLREIVGDDGLLYGAALRERYPGYFMTEIAADALVRPSTTEQVAAVLALCTLHQQSVVVQGGMSGWVRATQTQSGDLALSLERLNQIEAVDTTNRTVTVQAGVILQTLQEHLEPYGLAFPLDLGGRGSCHVGGNAATNAGGMRVIRYGMMREQVLGVEAVLSNGTVVSSLNRMIKNNTGYDLKQLFIGSEGTLGVITRLVLRLREQPRSNNTALVAATSFEQLVGLLRHTDAGLGGLLSAFELVDQHFYRVNTGPGRHAAPLGRDYPYYAIIEALGSNQTRDAALFESVMAEGGEKGLFEDAVVAASERQRADIWAVREDLQHIVRDFQPFYAFDVSLPVGEMANYMHRVRDLLHARWPEGLIAFLGHVGDGNLHIAIGAGTAQDREAVEACVYQPLAPFNGSVSAEHGIGLEKLPYLGISRSRTEIDLMLSLKDLLDPAGILNPGKIFGERSAKPQQAA